MLPLLLGRANAGDGDLPIRGEDGGEPKSDSSSCMLEARSADERCTDIFEAPLTRNDYMQRGNREMAVGIKVDYWISVPTAVSGET